MIVLHVEVGLVTREKYTDFLPLLFPNPPGSHMLLNLHVLKTPHGTEMVRVLSQSFFEKTLIYPDSRLSVLGEL